jgi:hypothetical protein
MDLKIYPNKSSIQDFHVYGFVVLSFRDEILTDDNKFAPVQFFEPRIFSTVDQAQSYIDSNGLSQKGFFVWKMFDCYGCRGYSNLDSDDESLKKFMDEEKENILMFSDFDDF